MSEQFQDGAKSVFQIYPNESINSYLIAISVQAGALIVLNCSNKCNSPVQHLAVGFAVTAVRAAAAHRSRMLPHAQATLPHLPIQQVPSKLSRILITSMTTNQKENT